MMKDGDFYAAKKYKNERCNALKNNVSRETYQNIVVYAEICLILETFCYI